MRKMMGLHSKSAAEVELKSLTNWLRTISDDAEKSVHELGVTGEFRNALSTTNAIESLIGVSKPKLKNVKDWGYQPTTSDKVPRDKSMRWVATAIQTHRSKMRRLRGGKEQMKNLINNLSVLDSDRKTA